MENEHIAVDPIAGALGAEVDGVDLSQTLADDVINEIRGAWLEHKLLFFRDQELTPEQHIAFASLFGDVQAPGFVPTLDGYPQIKRQEMNEYSQVGTDVTWHTDDSFNAIPSRCSVLYALDVPPSSGDTTWINLNAAYEGLSDKMKSFLEGLTAIHDLVETMGPGVLRQYGGERWQQFRDSTPPVEHPVIRTHPETGLKSLFVNPLMTYKIKDLGDDESRALLEFLYQHMQQPEFTCRFRWRKHSVAFWDNRITAHKGINDFFPAHRLMHRVAIADDQRPV
ncbi:MAG: TauD/TfdA dioxygenase family protein [Gammaproteobacteria bacterium]